MHSTLNPRIEQSLRAFHELLLTSGELMPRDRLSECCALFRGRFGPERLRSLDGEDLLNTMHLHGNPDSLVYWLEFKSDSEFQTRKFGGIGGGSALKFGLYKNKESGEWMTGHPSKQITLSLAEAIVIARRNRDQLADAVLAMEGFRNGADDQAYLLLQKQLDEIAPDVCRLAWGHKYLSLLFPDKLDDFHAEHFQRHNLIKLLQQPPSQDGLYVSAGRFVSLAAQMEWPMNHLTAVLNARNGVPTSYWRIGTKLGEGADAQNVWPEMLAGRYAAIGWAEVGDLASALAVQNSKEVITEMLKKEYPDYAANVASRKAGEIRNFALEMSENDVVLAADGELILGLGLVKGPYYFESTQPEDAPHRRQVEWHVTEKWKLPVTDGLRTSVWRLKKDDQNLVAVERKLLEPSLPLPPLLATSTPAAVNSIRKTLRLEGAIPGKLQAILERKGQAILYGPPGTGKSHWGKLTALDLTALGAFGCLYAELSPEHKVSVDGTGSSPGFLRCCTFHPAFGYEDFIEGYRPLTSAGGQLIFEKRDGIFKTLCRDAAASDQTFVLLIDEINRGDIPRIFGELITLLEKNKRGQQVTLPLSGDKFSVPPNVFVIGTMNTADRSIALLDTALRRRFGFVELMPDSSTLSGASVGNAIPLGLWLDALNSRVRKHVGKDARNQQIGHAYLMDEHGNPVTDFTKFSRILAEDIIPLLEEYCYEDYDALNAILGGDLVDHANLRVREELFLPARRQELIQALLSPTPELSTTLEATTNLPPTTEAQLETEDEAEAEATAR